MSVLGIIPARGGSRGIPKKNLARVAGETLLRHAVRSGRQSRAIRHLIVSTEDDEIRQEAMECGVQVCDRPIEFAADDSEMIETVMHATDWAERYYQTNYQAVVILQPTSPLRIGDDIDGCLDLLEQAQADSVVSVVETHPRSWMTDALGQPIWFTPAWNNRQKLPRDYVRNGAVYATRRDVLRAGMLFGPVRRAYEMPRWRSVNVNGPEDLIICEAFWNAHYRGGGSGARGQSD